MPKEELQRLVFREAISLRNQEISIHTQQQHHHMQQ
jgi:hypothetical protein